MAGLLFAKAWIDMDYNWDSLAYHVPFAALRTALVSPDQYILPPSLQAVFDGFPVVQDYLKGWLWKLSGNVNAVNLPTVAALVGMCVALASSPPWRFRSSTWRPSKTTSISFQTPPSRQRLFSS